MIGKVYRYHHGPHAWAIGQKVLIVAAYRGEEIVRPDQAILPTDQLEFRPWIEEENRWSWVTSDATLDQLEDL
ncbi:MAG TPA: hypothetical protein PKA37_03810 [Planctomycetota bacterium]|nr:hypothetical protein [Planctomycetota bacterium]